MKYKLNTLIRTGDFVEYLKENKKTFLIVVLAVIALEIILIVKNDNFNGNYVADRDGNIIGISRDDLKTGMSVPITVTAKNEKGMSEKNLMLYLQGKSKKETQNDMAENNSDLLDDAIDSSVSQVKNSDEKIVMLPSTLENGTKLFWEKPKKKINILPILFLPAILFILYRNEISKEKQKKNDKKSYIEKSLPMFNNQVLLLLNSGLIFNDAFNRIADGYRRRKLSERMPLEKSIVDIYMQSHDTNSSLITLLNIYSKEIEVREFSRIVAIISDNQYKGVNLSEKLEGESNILWENRKKTAEERGKIAETKLTFPLAILLLVLILITAAPAILQI